MGIIDRFKAASLAFRFPANMTHRAGSFLSLAPRTFPYENTDPIANSAVINTLAWIQRNFNQAEFQVYREDRQGNETEIAGHPLTSLIYKPNIGYASAQLWAATLLSFHLDGNAYWIKERNLRGRGIPTGLWYEPHWAIKPHWPEDGSAFIDYYERRINGTIEQIPVENVVHFRNGLNPANPRYGLAPLKASLLQIFTDTEVSLWVAALCRNMAIPGVVVSPTENIGMSGEKAEQIKQVWKRKFGGDNRGEPLILDFQASISTLGFDPKQMDFASISNLAESRISGALGIPAIVAGLSAGLDSSTYNNLANLKKSAFEECLIPTWEIFADTITDQLLIDFERDPLAQGIECEFDTSEIRALQENQSEKETRALAAWSSGIASWNETRAQFGYDPEPSGDIFLLPSTGKLVSASQLNTIEAPQPLPSTPPAAPAIPETGQAGLFPAARKSYEWDGMTLRRQPTELEARFIKQIDEAFKAGALSMRGRLLSIRSRYVTEALDALGGLSTEDYYTLTVRPTDQDRLSVLSILLSLAQKGARLILDEMANQGRALGDPKSSPNERSMSLIAGTLISKLANDVQARATGSASSAVVLGQDVRDTVARSFDEGSTAYVDRIAAEGTNYALSAGRSDEIRAQAEDIGEVIYSAVLDANTCEPCADSDGLRGQVDELPAVPNPACPGGAQCRCVLIPVVVTEFKGQYQGVEIDLKPTSAMKAEAKRGLEWRQEFNRGGTAVGVARARDISNGKELSPETVRRMFSYFSRHEVDKQGQGFSPGEDGYPSAGRIAWALWGGDPGYTWAKARVRRMDNIDEDA